MKMRRTLIIAFSMAVALTTVQPHLAVSQEGQGGRFVVTESVDSVELIAGTSRRLKFEYKVPELMIENPEVISATPVAPNEILISGLKPGVSTITVSDANKNLQTIRIHVTVDTRQLEMAFRTHFPDSEIKVHALQTGVLLGGNVARADQVSNIMSVARDFFPTGVVNQMQVNGSQNIAIKVKIYEVARSKLRNVGIDWQVFGSRFNVVNSVSDLITNFTSDDGITFDPTRETLLAGVMSGSGGFNAVIELLERRNVAKLLDEPVLVAQNGRPAEFLSGGEIPIAVASGLGTNSIEFRAFGTKLDIVPLVHGQGLMSLEIRAEVSEVATDLATAGGTPGFRVRRVNTGVRMRAGHTLALAGDFTERTSSSTRGVPKLMDSPLFGPLFRSATSDESETELVFLITPQYVSDVDAAYASGPLPGASSDAPSDRDLFINGHIEVPRCKEDCPTPNYFDNSSPSAGSGIIEHQPIGVSQGVPQVMPQASTSQYHAAPPVAVNSGFDSSFNFPGDGSSRRAGSRVADAQTGGGFLWPTNSQTR
jgi:pilus assembly protein CpaC